MDKIVEAIRIINAEFERATDYGKISALKYALDALVTVRDYDKKEK